MIYEDTSCYDDIINLPHPVSINHAKMTRLNRAAQFAPFAALNGHGEAIKETARFTSEKIQLDEEDKAELDRRLKYIQNILNKGKYPKITCVYFKPDLKKNGGIYFTDCGLLKKIDTYKHIFVIEKIYPDKELPELLEIPIDEIIDLYCSE